MSNLYILRLSHQQKILWQTRKRGGNAEYIFDLLPSKELSPQIWFK